MFSLTEIVLFLIALLLSVSLHEMMHAYVAYYLGDDLAHSHGRISLNPLAHIDPILSLAMPAVLLLLGAPPILAAKPVPINTSRIRGEELGLAAVGIAGPFTNLALAFVGGLLLQLVSMSGLLLGFVEMFVLVNVSLFVFNMLPIPPLDGSRVLYAVAPEGLRSIMRQIESFGIFFLVAILLLALPVISPILETLRTFILGLVL